MSRVTHRWARLSAGAALFLALAWTLWPLLASGSRGGSYATRVDELGAVAAGPAPGDNAGSDDGALLDRAIAATVWDELFPERAQTPDAPPPTPPTIDLIAIITRGEMRYAVLHDRATNVYYNARVGEALTRADLPREPARDLLPPAAPLVARLLALGERHAVLELAGREVRIEANP